MIELLNCNELIALCRNNEQQAQFEIYRKHNKVMYNMALRITNDVILADEATHEGFILSFRILHKFEIFFNSNPHSCRIPLKN